MMALVSSDELAKDVTGAEALLERHQVSVTLSSRHSTCGELLSCLNYCHSHFCTSLSAEITSLLAMLLVANCGNHLP